MAEPITVWLHARENRSTRFSFSCFSCFCRYRALDQLQPWRYLYNETHGKKRKAFSDYEKVAHSLRHIGSAEDSVEIRVGRFLVLIWMQEEPPYIAYTKPCCAEITCGSRVENEFRTATVNAMQCRHRGPRDAPLLMHAVPANTGILGMQALASECLYRSCQYVLGRPSHQLLHAKPPNCMNISGVPATWEFCSTCCIHTKRDRLPGCGCTPPTS
jgi:hypothetical protein